MNSGYDNAAAAAAAGSALGALIPAPASHAHSYQGAAERNEKELEGMLFDNWKNGEQNDPIKKYEGRIKQYSRPLKHLTDNIIKDISSKEAYEIAKDYSARLASSWSLIKDAAADVAANGLAGDDDAETKKFLKKILKNAEDNIKKAGGTLRERVESVRKLRDDLKNFWNSKLAEIRKGVFEMGAD